MTDEQTRSRRIARVLFALLLLAAVAWGLYYYPIAPFGYGFVLGAFFFGYAVYVRSEEVDQ